MKRLTFHNLLVVLLYLLMSASIGFYGRTNTAVSIIFGMFLLLWCTQPRTEKISATFHKRSGGRPPSTTFDPDRPDPNARLGISITLEQALLVKKIQDHEDPDQYVALPSESQRSCRCDPLP